jgi:hypothetical protein
MTTQASPSPSFTRTSRARICIYTFDSLVSFDGIAATNAILVVYGLPLLTLYFYRSCLSVSRIRYVPWLTAEQPDGLFSFFPENKTCKKIIKNLQAHSQSDCESKPAASNNSFYRNRCNLFPNKYKRTCPGEHEGLPSILASNDGAMVKL